MEHGSNLLSLGTSKTLTFPTDPASWSSSRGSSAIIPSSGDGVSTQENDSLDNHSSSSLKEHDYIGLAEVSSKSEPDTQSPSDQLHLAEPDLHLGLGLGLGPSKKTTPIEVAPREGVPKASMDNSRSALPESQKLRQSVVSIRPSTGENPNSGLSSSRDFQTPKACLPLQDYGEGTSRVATTFYGSHSPALKNGTKRGYTEAMNEAAHFMVAETRVTAVAAPATMVVKNGDGDVKAMLKHPQAAFMAPNWIPTKPSTPAQWQGGLEQSLVHSNKPMPPMAVTRVEKVDRVTTAYKPHDLDVNKESAASEPPPSKGQVVGWPPIRSYRKNIVRPTEMFVKVNMDGMTVGRKVDLNAHSSYEGLLVALEEMFQPSTTGQGTSQASSGREDCKHFRLLNGSDFVLTYEDEDGDWMLVGDVPWSMFVNMVRRLRITRGSEATGLAPRRPADKVK